MHKRLLAALLVALMLWCGLATAEEPRDFMWDEWTFRAVYDWQIDRWVNVTHTRFDVFYGAPLGEEGELKQFWVGYVPEGAEFGEALYFVPCAPEDHFFKLTDSGEVVPMISERTLQQAYEYWQICSTEILLVEE